MLPKRGYTGHEMIDEFGLINMNGRIYDPQLCRFLAPDRFVQAPGNSQSFNRYSYCLNNPLKYTDPSGNFFWIPVVVAVAVGGYVGYEIGKANGAEGWDMAGYILMGAAIGGFSAGIGASFGAAVSASIGGAASGIIGIGLGGALAGCINST